jgi:hypothetical protein
MIDTSWSIVRSTGKRYVRVPIPKCEFEMKATDLPWGPVATFDKKVS